MKAMQNLTLPGDEQSFWDVVFCQTFNHLLWTKGRDGDIVKTTFAPLIEPVETKRRKPNVSQSWLRTAARYADLAVRLRRERAE